MRFTRAQYDAAIAALVQGAAQLEPDGACCAICGDSGHQAWECGGNPLYAMAVCVELAKQGERLHEELHMISDRIKAHEPPAYLDGGASLDGLVNLINHHREANHELLYLMGATMHMGESIGPSKVSMLIRLTPKERS